MAGREIGSGGEGLPLYHRVSTGEMPPYMQLFSVQFVSCHWANRSRREFLLSHRVVMQTQGFFTPRFRG